MNFISIYVNFPKLCLEPLKILMTGLYQRFCLEFIQKMAKSYSRVFVKRNSEFWINFVATSNFIQRHLWKICMDTSSIRKWHIFTLKNQ